MAAVAVGGEWVADGVGVGGGIAAIVDSSRASTVASRSGVGSCVGVAVGAAAWVAAIPASTVAPISGDGVGGDVGSALAMAASTVASTSGVASGRELGATGRPPFDASPAQAGVGNNVNDSSTRTAGRRTLIGFIESHSSWLRGRPKVRQVPQYANAPSSPALN